MRVLTSSLAGALLLALLPAAGWAQGYAPRESVTVTPNVQYRAGAFHRFFFGTRYRALWTTPIRIPVLHLGEFAGGLTPSQRGGGQQTKSLRFTAPDGREFQFRSVDKDPTKVLPPELRETFAADLLQDQISSAHPVGTLVVAPLLEAAGVLHPNPVLVQMADDPALGEYRADFANVLGIIEERPKGLADEGVTFAGASDIVGTGDLFKQLDDEPAVRVDDRAFLLARLTDVFVGDWDRHDDQWRWALIDSAGRKRWLPIPRDRDQAFVRFDGLLLTFARRAAPQLLNFGPEYGDITGATWNGRDLDRRFLSGLERPVWDSIATALKARLSDAAIAAAVGQLPPEFQLLDGPRLSRALRARRDALDAMAREYYALLAHQVEIYGTDKVDQARVTRQEDGTTLVTLAHNDAEFFRRRFDPGETGELRLRLQGGGDRLVVDGKGRSTRLIRAIGGGGDDRFEIVRRGGVHLYDDRGANRAEGAGINRKPWRWKPDSLKPNELPPRDWGRNTILWINGSYGYDVQAILGYGGHTDWFGFRRVPYSTRLDYRIEVATGKLSGRATLGLTRQFENSPGFFRIEGMGSGIELLRWYGFGNETAAGDDIAFHRVNQNQLSGGMRLGLRFGSKLQNELSAGPLLRWSQTDLSEEHNAVRFIAVDRPYGVGRFSLAGLRAGLRLEGRDHPHFASKGYALTLQATGYPALLDADEAIGRIEGEGSLSLAPQGRWRPSLNFMAGGVKTWGKLPFFIAPSLGGIHTLRGYRPDRFAGEASAYGSVELRVPLLRLKLVVPGAQGVFGFADGGRVFVRGQSSDEWHTTAGGGVWFSFLSHDNVVYVGAGRPTKDKEGTRLILGFGFPY